MLEAQLLVLLVNLATELTDVDQSVLAAAANPPVFEVNRPIDEIAVDQSWRILEA